MKTASYLRIYVALVTITAIACSDPMDETTHPVSTKRNTFPTSHGEYHSSVTTWTRGDDGRFRGLVTQTPNTDLATADVFVFKDGKRISVDKQLDVRNVHESQSSYGEYYWMSYQNNVLFLNYIGMTVLSPPPFPLEVIIVY